MRRPQTDSAPGRKCLWAFFCAAPLPPYVNHSQLFLLCASAPAPPKKGETIFFRILCILRFPHLPSEEKDETVSLLHSLSSEIAPSAPGKKRETAVLPSLSLYLSFSRQLNRLFKLSPKAAQLCMILVAHTALPLIPDVMMPTLRPAACTTWPLPMYMLTW